MLALVRRGAIGLFGAVLVAPIPQALPTGGDEDGCVHLVGYGGQGPRVRATPANQQGGSLDVGICAVDDARANRSTPVKTTADFVPITGDDSLGFYVVYGVHASPTGGIAGNVTISLLELANGEVLVFGSGYGNIPGANLYDAAYDMERVDQVIRYCMGKDPASTPLRWVAPHGHGDHINPACNRELERLGYRVVEIVFHEGDYSLVNGMAWTSADRSKFRILPQATSCLQEQLTYASPLGKIWFFDRPGHTPGSIDLVIDTRNDPTNRFVIRGSQPSTPCAPLPGQREIIDAHGNVELLAVPPTLADVAPLAGTSLGGTPVTLTGTRFTAEGAGTHVVLFDGVPATGVVVASDTQITCNTPTGPPGQLVAVAVVNDNGKSDYSGTYYFNALPTVTSISPANGDWRGGTIVQVRGTGFLLTSGVNEVWFGAKRSPTVSVKSDGLLTCRAPSGTPGTVVDLLLRNPNGEATLPGAYLYNPDLAITDIEPTSGTSLGGTNVLLTGFAFTGDGSTPAVTFGGEDAAAVTLLSDTSVSCVAPAGTPGATVDLVLSNSAGTATFSGFRYHALPTATLVAPASGRPSGGTPVTLTGSGFLVDAPGPCAVRFGGIPATLVTVLSDTALTCLTPGGATGTQVNVTVSNLNGTATLPLSFTYAQPLEALAILPPSGSSQGGTPVTFTGSGFVEGPAGATSVLFGGVPATQVTAVDDATLTCVAPAGTPLSVVDVMLSNSNGTATLTAAYRYHATPTLAAISPGHGHAGAFTPVTLTGTGFLEDDAGFGLVVVGGVAASDVDVLGDTLLSCVVPPGPPGAVVDVLLLNQNGTATLPGAFRYHTAPTLATVTPGSGSAGSQQRVTLAGTGFLDDQAGPPAITFGGLSATDITVVSDQSVRCNVPVGTPGQTVTAVLGNARGSASLNNGYRYHARPAITGLTPDRGTYLGGTLVTLSGSGFQVDAAGTNVVTFGGAPATSVVALNDATIQCRTPAGTRDAVVDVSVTNGNGTGTRTLGFSYSVPPPSVVALTPASGPAHVPGSVQVTGAGFVDNSAGTNTVLFGSTPSGIVGVIDDRTLSCQVPPGAPGTRVDVVVNNANGSGSLVQGFRYHAEPALTGIAPESASSLGGSTVTLVGSGFLADAAGTNAVTFGGLPATLVTVLDDARLTCAVPAGAPGTEVEVRVTNANGSTGTRAFAFHALPSLTSLDPISGPATGNTRVTVQGSGFAANGAGANLVRFGPKPALIVVVLSDTTLTCDTPRGDPGYVDVLLSNANGSDVLVGGYHYGRLPPALLSVEPASGTSAGGTLVTLKGRGFEPAGGGTNRVKFGDALSPSVITVDDETVLCTAPRGAPGAVVDVALNNVTGTVTLPQAFRYHALPTLAAVTPSEGEPLGATIVTIVGTGFAVDSPGATSVRFDFVPARDVVVVDDRHITCRPYGGGPGSVLDVSVRNENGSATLPDAYRIVGGPPTVTTVKPVRGPFTGGTSITVTGSGFSASPVSVQLGSARASRVVVLGDTLLTCTTPPGTLGQTVTVSVQTRNGVAALVGGFTYEAIKPALAQVLPDHGPASGGKRVSLIGSGFQAQGAGATRVTFGGSAASNLAILDDRTIACDVPAGTTGARVNVVVQNDNGSATLANGFRYNEPPAVTAAAPARGPAEGGTAVSLTGRGFLAEDAGSNLVLFGGVAALDVVEVSDTTLTCTTPPGVPGAQVDILVANGNGAGTLADAFRYHGAPVLTSLTPDHGPTAAGTAVTLNGSGFLADDAGACTVTFGGLPATQVVVLDDRTLTCRAPAGSAGARVDVAVANANGSSVLASGYRYHAAPTITSIVPGRGPASGGTSVTITGTGFLVDDAGPANVIFGGFAADAVTVTSDTTLVCVTHGGIPNTQVNVTVANANGSATRVNGFIYNALPTLTGVSPASGSAQGGTLVTLSGSGFAVASPGPNTVTFGGAPAANVTVVSDSTLTCVTPPGTGATVVDVRLSNANGEATRPASFRYNPVPTLGAVAPSSGPAAGGTVVTLTGSGFADPSAGATLVTFGGAAAADVQVLDDRQIRCTTPAGTGGAVVEVAVVNDNGTAALGAAWRYHALPVLAAVDPARGSSAVSSPVTLRGSGFLADDAGPNTVLFGAVAASNVVVVDDATLTCEIAPAPAGSVVDVSVANRNGTAVLLAAFAFDAPAPVLASIDPTSGVATGGTPVTLTGSGFQAFSAGTNTVTFGGASASDVVVIDDATLQCTTPPGTVGATVDVAVSNSNGGALLPAAFTYFAPAPALLSVTPGSGPAAGGGTVTLTGSGFAANDPGANAVAFGGTSAANVVVLGNTTLTCQVPAGAAGTQVDVTLSNANGAALLAAGYRYHALPVITSIAPVDGTSLGGTLVTVRGSGFLADGAGTNVVRFGATAATSVVVYEDGRLTCRAPSGPAGTIVDVSLQNANGAALLASAYRYHARPTLTAVTPASGPAAGGTSVELTGTGFLADGAVVNVVSFGGVAATGVTVVNDRTIRCNVPAGTAGLAVQVTVANMNGTAILPAGYRYHARPTLAAVTPGNGPAAGGTTVMLTGSGFQVDSPGTSSVTFGGAPATAVSVIDDTQLTCVTPAGAEGTAVDVLLANANGAVTLAGGFAYDVPQAPIVAGILPGKGSTQGSTPVTLTGTGFVPGSSVTFGTAAAENVVVLDERTLTCLTPASAEVLWIDVSVEGPTGRASLPLGFRYVAPPTLSAIEPPQGSPDGGDLVVLVGTGFLDDAAGPNQVAFGGRAALSVAVIDDQHLACEVPAGPALTEAEVVVANENGSARLALAFRWQYRLATDLDSDGRGDLVLGSSGDDTLARDAGAVHVFLGTALPILDRTAAEADLTALPERGATGFGSPVASGDLDGDGRAELLIGAPLDDRVAGNSGAVYVYSGPLAASAAPLIPSQATGVLSGSLTNERFGSALCLRDVDRDGYLDVLVGAPGRTPGAAHLFLGGPAGPGTQPAVVIRGEFGNEDFATSLAAGDLDGDGWPELAIGASNAFGDLASSPTGKSWHPGEVRVFRGGPAAFAGGNPAPWLIFSGQEDEERFGAALAVRDISGDGIDDLIVGSPSSSRSGSESGSVAVFLGRSDLAGADAGAAQAIFSAEAASDRLGSALAAGDVDGDGQADLLVGAPGHAGTGRAYLLLGTSQLAQRSVDTAEVVLLAEPGSSGEFGSTVALVDVDGDGREDMVVTAPALGGELGRAYVFGSSIVLGSREAASSNGALTGDQAGDRLGQSVTSDH